MEYLFDALTFDDVLLVPAHSEILPAEVSLKTRLTRELSLNIPLISSAMDTVTESSLAIAMAEKGGIGILHKNMTIEAQAKQAMKVKKHESGIVRNPITVTPDMTLAQVRNIQKIENISGLPVVQGKKLVGIITNRDIRFETDLYRRVSDLMTRQEKLITAKENVSEEEILALFKTHPIEKLPLINDMFELKGLITVKDILRTRAHPYASKNKAGQLCVGAAVGIGKTELNRVDALLEVGVDVIVVDTAHGHSQGVLNQVKTIKKQYSNQIQVIAGNVATADAANALISVGVDAIKVGVGPGSICTTRVVTGVGMPQISAIYHTSKAAKAKDIPIIADGGIRFSGDICKALAAGADTVMLGSLFAGTAEAPGEIVLYKGRSYKSYRGMGSLGAMSSTNGSHDRYFQEEQTESRKYIPEGIEGRVPYRGKISAVLYQLLGGLRSSMGYLGCKTIDELHRNAKFVKVTSAGVHEGHVHDVIITKEAPNYWLDSDH